MGVRGGRGGESEHLQVFWFEMCIKSSGLSIFAAYRGQNDSISYLGMLH